MASQTEVAAPGEFIISEANGTRSRENVVVASGAGVVPAGRVMGKVTAGGKYIAWTSGAADGSQTAAGVLYAQVDATAADAIAVVIARDAEVVSARVSTVTGAQKAAGLTSLQTACSIFAR